MINTPVKTPHKESASMVNSKLKDKQLMEEVKKEPPELMRAGKALSTTDDGLDLL
jgi:hypothetical protein